MPTVVYFYNNNNNSASIILDIKISHPIFVITMTNVVLKYFEGTLDFTRTRLNKLDLFFKFFDATLTGVTVESGSLLVDDRIAIWKLYICGNLTVYFTIKSYIEEINKLLKRLDQANDRIYTCMQCIGSNRMSESDAFYQVFLYIMYDEVNTISADCRSLAFDVDIFRATYICKKTVSMLPAIEERSRRDRDAHPASARRCNHQHLQQRLARQPRNAGRLGQPISHN